MTSLSHRTYYRIRFVARLVDLLLVGVIVRAFQSFDAHFGGYFLLWFLIYNAVVILSGGQTLGKYSLSLSIVHRHQGVKRILALLVRELLIWPLLPLLFLNALFGASQPLHDRLTGTRVTRDEF